MPAKWLRSGATFSETPWKVTQRRTRTPIAAILSSAAAPRGPRGLSGRATQTPTRSARLSPSLHLGQRRLVAGQTRRDEPFDRERAGPGGKRRTKQRSGIGHGSILIAGRAPGCEAARLIFRAAAAAPVVDKRNWESPYL